MDVDAPPGWVPIIRATALLPSDMHPKIKCAILHWDESSGRQTGWAIRGSPSTYVEKNGSGRRKMAGMELAVMGGEWGKGWKSGKEKRGKETTEIVEKMKLEETMSRRVMKSK
ncbi:hypothetical protein RUM44_010251 [Polyplax serrata]|uniref:Uncharacterized protein n=1 Tax=Polyplax serrata TaxID=468196 RepID=A0ABR1AV07_POLSC